MMSGYVYDDRAAQSYDLAVPVEQGEIDFHLGLAREAEAAGLRTLELACGTGRVAVPLAAAGVRIVGVDSSPSMLARARDKSAGIANAEWVQGDMRSFDLGEKFGLIFITAGTFQLLLETEDQLACLRCVREHLAPGGRFAFNVEGPDIVMMASWLTDRRGTYVRRPQRDYVDPETGHRMQSWATSEYHPSTQRYAGSGFVEEVDDDGEVVRKRYGKPMELRYFGRYEIEHMLARCGLGVEALYSGFDKGAYRGTAMYWVARRGDG
jgi:SAM-dependent methyltransferase